MINKIKCERNIIEKLSEIIIIKLNSKLNKEGLALTKMKFGMEVLLINLSKALVLFLVGAQLNLLKETIFMTLVFGSVRKSAFGLHAKSSIVCTIVTLLMFVGGSYIGHYLNLNNYEIALIFTLFNILLYKYAPADTEKHPLISEKLRKKLRKETVSTGILLMIITVIIPSQLIKSLIVLSVGFEVINILPITYKIFNRRYRNYEQYEK